MMSLAPRSVRIARAAGKTAAPVPARAVRRAATAKEPKVPEVKVDTDALAKQAQETAGKVASELAAKWEATEEKPAAIAISVAALFAVYLASGVMSAVDRLPLFSDLFELIGIGATAWFTYRYLIYGPDREELVKEATAFFSKVAGK